MGGEVTIMNRIKRIYKADKNDYCASCGKKASIPDKNSMTVVFEACSIKEIIAELKWVSENTGVLYCEIARITYKISEE